MNGQRQQQTLFFNNRSVSPVVGTVLLVAVVIVVAATVGATAFGTTDRLGSTPASDADNQCAIEFDPQDVDEFADAISACSAAADSVAYGENIISFSVESDYWRFHLDNDPDNGEEHGEYIVRSADKIEFDRVETVYVEWEHESTPDQRQDVSFLGVDPDREQITRANARDGNLAAQLYNSDTNFDRRVDELDTSEITDRQSVGVGAELSSSHDQYVTLRVWRVWGENANGDTVFELGNP